MGNSVLMHTIDLYETDCLLREHLKMLRLSECMIVCGRVSVSVRGSSMGEILGIYAWIVEHVGR